MSECTESGNQKFTHPADGLIRPKCDSQLALRFSSSNSINLGRVEEGETVFGEGNQQCNQKRKWIVKFDILIFLDTRCPVVV